MTGKAGDNDLDQTNDAERDLYAECPVEGCLERIALIELEDHIDFHALEEQDEKPGVAHAPASDSTSASASATASPSSKGSNEYRSPYVGSRHAARQDHGERGKSDRSSAVEAWNRIFKRSQPSHSSESSSTSSKGLTGKKRLGVRMNSTLPPFLTSSRSHRGMLTSSAQKLELGKYAHEDKMPDSLVQMLKRGKYVSGEGLLTLSWLLHRQASWPLSFPSSTG